MKLSDYQVGKFVKAAIAGQPGRGKTTAGLSFPSPMLIFDFDGKLDGPILFAKKMGIDLSKIEVETPVNWQQVVRILNQEESNPRFKSYGFDTLTSLADMLLSNIQDVKLGEKGGQVKRIGGVQVPGLEEFNAESAGIMDLLLFMKNVKAHVWLSAHVIETKATTTGDDGKSRIVVNRSLLTGGKKVAAKIPAYFPENYSLQIEPPISSGQMPKYFCFTTSNSEDYGRTGFALPPKFEITGKLFFPELNRLMGQPGSEDSSVKSPDALA